ncbi:ABC transporter ATP-binding protein [Frankia sp. Cr1]|uniref:ABC transporter ATP-binding protein n=1 Tax=Frankia sp. Cr1 TaxID=3073931 RepID=UPI002AD47917|nr:ATP-binding cassette domain-containing protein [Frankia sp. Cr1]
MIEAIGLTKRYGRRTVVNGLTFGAGAGAVTGFLGPNGAGKSTTMRMIVGLDRPSDGVVTVNGRPFHQHRQPVREIGVLLDAGAVDPARTPHDHLRWLCASNGIARHRIDTVLEMVGLGDAAGMPAGRLSLGMTQRLGMAAALLGDPPTLVLDEPANGLDPDGITWIRKLLATLAREGRTVFLSSHLIAEIAQIADRLVVIGRGRLLAADSVERIIAGHGGPSVVVRSPRAGELAAVLRRHGAQVDDQKDAPAAGVERDGTSSDLLTVRGMDSGAIFDMAVAHGLRLVELSPADTSLEEAFTALTEASTVHRGALGRASPVEGTETQ